MGNIKKNKNREFVNDMGNGIIHISCKIDDALECIVCGFGIELNLLSISF
jgi:hypothetical protein